MGIMFPLESSSFVSYGLLPKAICGGQYSSDKYPKVIFANKPSPSFPRTFPHGQPPKRSMPLSVYVALIKTPSSRLPALSLGYTLPTIFEGFKLAKTYAADRDRINKNSNASLLKIHHVVSDVAVNI